MKEYEIFTFKDDINENVIFINSVEDLYFLYEEIIKDINNKNIKNRNILVDLFLRNGYTFNRYILLKLDKNNNFRSYIINPREVSENVKITIQNYLRKNKKLLENSTLSEKEIEFIKNKFKKVV